jgi:hypothetical protein
VFWVTNILLFKAKSGIPDGAMTREEWEAEMAVLHARLSHALQTSKLGYGCRVRLSIDEVLGLMESIEMAIGSDWFDQEA